MKIVIKRIYDPTSPDDGYRMLIDRLWPRGMTKEKANLSEWNKDLSPSSELRIWFHQNPDLWDDFAKNIEKNWISRILEKNGWKYIDKKLSLHYYMQRITKYTHMRQSCKNTYRIFN